MPPGVAEAIRRLDAESETWPEELRADWHKVRGYARSKHRESQRAMPAVSLAAQEMAQSRNHAQAALDAMSGVFGQRRDGDEDDS